MAALLATVGQKNLEGTSRSRESLSTGPGQVCCQARNILCKRSAALNIQQKWKCYTVHELDSEYVFSCLTNTLKAVNSNTKAQRGMNQASSWLILFQLMKWKTHIRKRQQWSHSSQPVSQRFSCHSWWHNPKPGVKPCGWHSSIARDGKGIKQTYFSQGTEIQMAHTSG